jgi:hypothetical protein
MSEPEASERGAAATSGSTSVSELTVRFSYEEKYHPEENYNNIV